MNGKIFDIRRFSVHDGSGIRTTVFFKGCPLRCVWCQNPEGIEPDSKMYHFASRCIGCSACLEALPGAVRQEDSKFLIDQEKIRGYESFYEELCPTGALRLNAKIYTSERLMAELLKDRVFFCAWRRGDALWRRTIFSAGIYAGNSGGADSSGHPYGSGVVAVHGL